MRRHSSKDMDSDLRPEYVWMKTVEEQEVSAADGEAGGDMG